MSAVYVARTTGTPRPGTDARAVVVVPASDLDTLDFAFDHRAIVHEYLAWRRRGHAPATVDPEPFRGGAAVARDVCT